MEYKFKSEKEVMKKLLDMSLEALEKQNYIKLKEFLYIIKYGGYKLDE